MHNVLGWLVSKGLQACKSQSDVHMCIMYHVHQRKLLLVVSTHLLGALKMPLSLESSFETVHFHPGFSEQASCLAKLQQISQFAMRHAICNEERIWIYLVQMNMPLCLLALSTVLTFLTSNCISNFLASAPASASAASPA